MGRVTILVRLQSGSPMFSREVSTEFLSKVIETLRDTEGTEGSRVEVGEALR